MFFMQNEHILPYFFGYKMEFFLRKQSQKSRSILEDGSRFLGLFRNGKTGIIAKFQRTDLVDCSHSRKGKTPSYCKINTVTPKQSSKFYLATPNEVFDFCHKHS